jgi:hypothetical protein
MIPKWCLLSFGIFLIATAYSQSPLRYFRITSPHTSFPDTGRSNGHIYHNILYSAAEHYSDSSVLIIVPSRLRVRSNISLIFWFHGWNNNIDTALIKYGIARQFTQSRLNAVLVLAETAKDAPDSYGGKLEQPGDFKELVTDVLRKLADENVIRKQCQAGHVILAGHSGAYRVMAGILQNGGVEVNEVILFDALYANTGQFMQWLTSDPHNRFIDLYTDHGGTLDETKSIQQQLKDMHIHEDSLEETAVTAATVRRQKILFIHSLHAHDDIIQHPDNFNLFLDNSPFLKRR